MKRPASAHFVAAAKQHNEARHQRASERVAKPKLATCEHFDDDDEATEQRRLRSLLRVNYHELTEADQDYYTEDVAKQILLMLTTGDMGKMFPIKASRMN